jgi:hypothetical protein
MGMREADEGPPNAGDSAPEHRGLPEEQPGRTTGQWLEHVEARVPARWPEGATGFRSQRPATAFPSSNPK